MCIPNAMKRLVLVPLLFLLLPVAAFAQKDNFWTDLNKFLDYRADKAYAKLDSHYIGRYPYHWDARVFFNTSGLHLMTHGLDNDVSLATGMSSRAGIGLSYRGIGLSYSVTLHKRMNFDFGLSSYGKRFSFEYILRASSELSGKVSWFGHENHQAEDGDLTLIASNLNLLYSFNPRFSYGAAMKQNAIQRRSAGSFILAGAWTIWDVLGAGPEIISKQTSIQTFLEQTNIFYNRFSFGAGYGYNLVFGHEQWLVHASVIPMWSFYDVTKRRVEGQATKYPRPMGRIAITGTVRGGIYYRWGTRWSVGLSSVVNQMSSRNNFHPGHKDYLRFGAQDWQARFSVGFRF